MEVLPAVWVNKDLTALWHGAAKEMARLEDQRFLQYLKECMG